MGPQMGPKMGPKQKMGPQKGPKWAPNKKWVPKWDPKWAPGHGTCPTWTWDMPNLAWDMPNLAWDMPNLDQGHAHCPWSMDMPNQWARTALGPTNGPERPRVQQMGPNGPGTNWARTA